MKTVKDVENIPKTTDRIDLANESVDKTTEN